MPGICGIAVNAPGAELQSQLTPMLDAMRHHDWYIESQHVDAAGAALGRMSLGFVNTAPQPVSHNSVLAVLDGELYEPDTLRRKLQSGRVALATDSHAEILLAGYLKFGQAFLRDVNGSFIAAFWTPQRRRLTLINDRFGLRILYYTQQAGKLSFSSNIRALMAVPEVSRAPSWCGLTQFFTFGQYLGCDTSLDSIKTLPAAACFEYDADEDRLTTACYATWGSEAAEAPASDAELLDRIDAAFKTAVDRRTADTSHLGLSLSGGLDARSILAVMEPDQQRSLQTLCLGIAGSQDHRSSEQMARLVGSKHTGHYLDTHFLSQFRTHLERMVELTDGQYLSQCIVMPTLPIYRQLGIEVLLRGHAGELMHMQKAYAYSLDAEALAIQTDAQLEAWLLQHLQAYMLDGVDRPLFAPQHQVPMADLARESLQSCLRESAGVEPPLQRIWHLFVSQRLRRETTLSLAKIGSVAEVRIPYLDHDLVTLLLAAPPQLKLGETIQRYIMQKRRPDFLDVINVNTGTRVGAGALAQKAASFRNRVFAKLGVPGYQPYERLGLWLRRELSPLVREILLSPACLERGVFDPDTVRQVVDRHLQNQRNHTFLIMAMMICELGQQQLTPDAHSSSPTPPSFAS